MYHYQEFFNRAKSRRQVFSCDPLCLVLLGPESPDGELEGAASLSVPGCSVPISVEPGSPDVFLGIALGTLRACICTDIYLFILMCDIGTC